MLPIEIKELLPLLRKHGRTVYDEERQALFFNWTCSGFTVCFRGRTLRARMTALSDVSDNLPNLPPQPPDFPYYGVVPDGADAPLSRRVFESPDAWETLFESPDAGEHSIRVVKLSENNRGKLGVLELETDGEFLPAPEEHRPRIEIVGDSITCAFGNRAENNAVSFRSDEEDGWMSYAALAARELGCEWSVVSESGICCSRPESTMFSGQHGMDEIYAFTDEPFDRRRGVAPRKWDFAAQRSDAVVLNLGTNDANPIRFYTELDAIPAVEDRFQRKYAEFLAAVRALNGPDTLIVCTLGPMDYYLWDRLRGAATQYRRDSGDHRLILFKFIPIKILTEGYGAVGHPSMKTHIRMGHELAHILKPYLP